MVTVELNIPVICYGLRSDFSLKGFPGSTRLLELAHTIEEMKTICTCGRKATCNCRKVNGEFVFEGSRSPSTCRTMSSMSACAPSAISRPARRFMRNVPSSSIQFKDLCAAHPAGRRFFHPFYE